MTQRCHDMPFGASFDESVGARFRLWGPGAARVDLALKNSGSEKVIRMRPQDGGWFAVTVKGTSPGDMYSFIIDGELKVPDPASRFQPEDVSGPSQVVNPRAFDWRDEGWKGRPWEEAVIYELHVGAFTPEGTFAAVREKMDYLADLGVNTVELMPVSDFPGGRNWGYDGVLPFAPDSAYGTPEDLKELVQDAHLKNMMVILDVVYNHFGPEGNYLHAYAEPFFSTRHETLWGAAINFDGEASRWVRQFFIHNALYWLEEYNLDGLRLDAVHAIMDDSEPDILKELAETVNAGLGKNRHVHLILENDNNAARYIERDQKGAPKWYAAQWNDDIHHALHVMVTGEREGYYEDYADDPAWRLGRCLTEGFAYQGESSLYRGGALRGEPSSHLPPSAFVSFLQNHDQVGNRAFGERINVLSTPEAVRAATAVILLAPSPPLLFMGQEWGASSPFLFFCDFEPELSLKVSAGRRNEFKRFTEFSRPETRERIPDPAAIETFKSSVLDWPEPEAHGAREWLSFYKSLLTLRRERIFPLLRRGGVPDASFEVISDTAVEVTWKFAGRGRLSMLANLGEHKAKRSLTPDGEILYMSDAGVAKELANGVVPPWAVACFYQNEE